MPSKIFCSSFVVEPSEVSSNAFDNISTEKFEFLLPNFFSITVVKFIKGELRGVKKKVKN